MAIAVRHSHTGNFLFRSIYNVERRIEENRLFRQTVRELNALTERELADLNLSRADIRRVAREAVASR